MTMRIKTKAKLAICVGLLCFLVGGCWSEPTTQSQLHDSQIQQSSQIDRDKERAIQTAIADALENNRFMNRSEVVACETARVWLIIEDNGGPEYVISKGSGDIISRKLIPPPLYNLADDGNSKRDLTRQEAIEIVKREAETLFGGAMHRYNVFACELGKSWKVAFEYREVPGEELPNSRSPVYVVDKKTGRVVYKEG